MSILLAILFVVAGLVIAFYGKRVMWLVAGAAGFALGYILMQEFFSNLEEIWVIIISVGVGLVCAFLTTRFLRLFAFIAAFIFVGLVATVIAETFFDNQIIYWAAFFVGGLIGLAIMRFAFGPGIILITALGGAALVVKGLPWLLPLPLWSWLNLVVGLVVAIGGIFIQTRFNRGK